MGSVTLASALVALLASGAVTAAIQAFVMRRSRQVDISAKLSEMADTVIRRVEADNTRLRRELMSVKAALGELTDTLDQMLPHLQGLTEDQLYTLRLACRTAKLGLSPS
jgi:hypothetical protein